MSEGTPPPRQPFRWQALLQGATEAVFVLDRRRRLLFVNAAWQTLTGLSAERARGLFCRRRGALPDEPLEDRVAHALTPPPEARAGRFARVRRAFHGRTPGEDGPAAAAWWDVEFLPLRQTGEQEGCSFVGRIVPVEPERPEDVLFLPERLVSLRARRVGRCSLDRLAAASPAMTRLARQVPLAASSTLPVLLDGEPGSGRETAARLIHYLGSDGERAFAALDCRRLPAEAVAALIVPASPPPARMPLGAVYLREADHLPLDVQRRIADWLAAEPARPRLFAGCVDARAAVRAGRLLAELYWRLSPLTLEVPPLRERRDDLPRLVAELSGAPALTAAAWELVRQYPWPGNLPQLRRALADAARLAGGRPIDAAHLPLAVRLEQPPAARPDRPLDLDALLQRAERRIIELALRRVRGNRTRAADLLGIHRARLLRRLEALGIEPGEAELEPADEEPAG